MGTLLTVIETEAFISDADYAGMTEEDRVAVVNHVSANPEDGDRLGGGLFKVRIARVGRGKSKGWRVIVGYRSKAAVVYLLTVFAKGDRANLTRQELQFLKDLMRKELGYEGE
jgi:hypothetical protein